ncbi:MAG TPA: hypothetical protein VE843_02915 [Ktedonobacteraceae bacterium]|nr:hypothetical protein [Ktedonobacteraceae bacterium]
MKKELPVLKKEGVIVLPVTQKGLFEQALPLDRDHASQLGQAWWRNAA